MKQMVALLSVLAVLTALSSCRAAPPAPPSLQTVSCEVTALTVDAEYRIDVRKETDELATYCFRFPAEADGLTYEFLGAKRRVSFHGSELPSSPALCGVADVLHAALTLGSDAFRYEDGCYVAASDQGQIRLSVLSDGNVSRIEAPDVGIVYYFNYAP